MPQVRDHRSSLGGGKDLRVFGAALRREETEPHLHDLRMTAPEAQKLIEVAGAIGGLRSDGAVDGDARVFDVVAAALIGGRCAPRIVLRLQAVDGYDDIELSESFPFAGDDPECAGDQLRMNTAALKLRKEQIDFAIAYQRIAADERHVQWLVLIDDGEHSRHQLISFEVGKLTQLWTLKMRCVEGITSRATQRTFFCDLDGEGGCAPGQNSGPRMKNLRLIFYSLGMPSARKLLISLRAVVEYFKM